MTLGDVKEGFRYIVRGDTLDVTSVIPGKTARSARVRFIVVKKSRPKGALEVGEAGELGIVNFVSWGRLLGKTPRPRT